MSDQGDRLSEEGIGNLDRLREGLLDSIDQVEGAGNFATGGVIEEHPNPCISVREGKVVSLPLRAEDARALEALSDVSVETAIDDAVSVIDAENITIHNPTWSGFVDRLAKRAAWEMGVPPGADGKPGIRAKLSRSLLYGRGATVKAEAGTVDMEGIFGRLIICLPSPHTGGTAHFRHGKTTISLSYANTSAFSCSHIAWLPDVLYGMDEIQTG
ncbi:hypothetical protein F5883DRAFT_651348 [Diaporthe sp. PMI_573]|nr:hypothetical protein F5883DRAFT_651348 [Diaporthaceae sp. PMI_573]